MCYLYSKIVLGTDQNAAVPNKHELQNNCKKFILKRDLNENRNWINRRTLLAVRGVSAIVSNNTKWKI